MRRKHLSDPTPTLHKDVQASPTQATAWMPEVEQRKEQLPDAQERPALGPTNVLAGTVRPGACGGKYASTRVTAAPRNLRNSFASFASFADPSCSMLFRQS
ncbi:MAG: hypothetical protein NW204_09110 [Xanthomonadaceae bacterium]|nr:hypothetical protein [Xanthomonadaceae bacterium]